MYCSKKERPVTTTKKLFFFLQQWAGRGARDPPILLLLLLLTRRPGDRTTAVYSSRSIRVILCMFQQEEGGQDAGDTRTRDATGSLDLYSTAAVAAAARGSAPWPPSSHTL